MVEISFRFWDLIGMWTQVLKLLALTTAEASWLRSPNFSLPLFHPSTPPRPEIISKIQVPPCHPSCFPVSEDPGWALVIRITNPSSLAPTIYSSMTIWRYMTIGHRSLWLPLAHASGKPGFFQFSTHPWLLPTHSPKPIAPLIFFHPFPDRVN